MEGEKKKQRGYEKNLTRPNNKTDLVTRNRAVRNKKVELMANTLTTCNEFAC